LAGTALGFSFLGDNILRGRWIKIKEGTLPIVCQSQLIVFPPFFAGYTFVEGNSMKMDGKYI